MKRLKNTKPKTKPNGWEEEFDKKFPFRGLTDGDYYTMTDIKDFIHQAILSAEETKVKEVEIIKDEDDVLTDWYQCPECLINEFDSYVRKDFIFCPWCGVKVKWVEKALSLPDQEQLSNTKTDE